VPRRRAPRSKTSAKVRKSMALAATAAVRAAAAGQELARADAEGGPILRGNRRYWAIPGQPVDLSEQVCDCASRCCWGQPACTGVSSVRLVAVLLSPSCGCLKWRSLRSVFQDRYCLILRLAPTIITLGFGYIQPSQL
jgi:hypothetical protein